VGLINQSEVGTVSVFRVLELKFIWCHSHFVKLIP